MTKNKIICYLFIISGFFSSSVIYTSEQNGRNGNERLSISNLLKLKPNELRTRYQTEFGPIEGLFIWSSDVLGLNTFETATLSSKEIREKTIPMTSSNATSTVPEDVVMAKILFIELRQSPIIKEIIRIASEYPEEVDKLKEAGKAAIKRAVLVARARAARKR